MNLARAASVQIDNHAATAVVRQVLSPSLNVTAMRPLTGGVMSTVMEWTTDGSPATLVAKLRPEAEHSAFAHEFAALDWYRKHTRLPVPEPFGCVSNIPGFSGTCLLMERIPGRNIAEAKIAGDGRRSLQIQLARHLAHLHSHRRATYGSALEDESQGQRSWIQYFRPAMQQTFAKVRDQLSSQARWAIEEIILHLEDWLPEFAQPTLIHGDVWNNNILIDDARPERPIVKAFIDVAVNFREVEYELSYLRVFGTVGETFFDEYRKHHKLRPGFSRRCRVYYLYFMMSHMKHFGPTYLKNCESLAQQLATMIK